MPPPRRYANAAERQAAYQKRRDAARDEEIRTKGLPPLPLIPTLPGARRWAGMLALARALMQGIRNEREAYYEDRSEDWQNSERGAALQERTETIADLLTAMDEIGEE